MNPLLKTILDGLTYLDLAGKRQPRLYTIVAGMLLLLVSITGGMAGLNRHLVMSRVHAVPEAVTLPTQTVERDATDTLVTKPDGGTDAFGCPTDPNAWSLTPTFISENYHVIQPACVYQGLEKTVAWALAVRQGYSRAEATELLGFTQMPMRQMETVMIPKHANERVDVPVSFIPPHPEFREWRLNERGEPAITYALRGCFETSSVEGNRVEVWGGDYPVICLVVEDAENTHILYALNDHMYISPATPMRSFLLFGYLGDEQWVWLGTQTEPKLEITNAEENVSDRLIVATLYDSQPWDAKWLSNTHHLDMQPLPENWQSSTQENEKNYILSILSGAAP
ncbi:MAG: hypothetical protein QY328_00770 [Anaerolineales bacterium]|jgi:hypothetical protein|nr:hypothetical protein [Anaerolineales bacterium]WKZ40568.1 MAG: hypothetical protein QY328_00770 [Anaerolineales bacterium]